MLACQCDQGGLDQVSSPKESDIRTLIEYQSPPKSGKIKLQAKVRYFKILVYSFMIANLKMTHIRLAANYIRAINFLIDL